MSKIFGKNIENYLNSFGKYVVKQARTNLTKAKKNVSKSLYNSIKYDFVIENNGDFSLQFKMDNYGSFIDKGVSGNKKKQSYTDWQGKKQNSPGKGYTTKGPPIDILSKWIKRKGIKPKGLGTGRSKSYTKKDGTKVKGTGQFISGFAFLISRKIKRDGIKGISFFQRPLGLAMKSFPKEFGAELKQDIIDTLNNK